MIACIGTRASGTHISEELGHKVVHVSNERGPGVAATIGASVRAISRNKVGLHAKQSQSAAIMCNAITSHDSKPSSCEESLTHVVEAGN